MYIQKGNSAAMARRQFLNAGFLFILIRTFEQDRVSIQQWKDEINASVKKWAQILANMNKKVQKYYGADLTNNVLAGYENPLLPSSFAEHGSNDGS